MSAETKTCQSCKREFGIEPEDFDFYTKIGVPPPTHCPSCRLERRMIWRNEHILYKRRSSLSGTEIISQYPADTPFPVYSIPEYYARDWEVPSSEYDPERSFFEQFRELQLQVPRRALLTDLQSIENRSVYQNAASRNKNCYLVFAAGDNEDCIYGHDVDRCRSVVDCLWTRRTERSYECIDTLECNRLFFSQEFTM